MDSGYISKEELATFKTQTDEAGKLLNRYINFLRKSISGNSPAKIGNQIK